MNCDQARNSFFDIIDAVSAKDAATASAHLADCAECAARLAALKKTMALMDEWKAPEPSPYFNTRFQARFAELKREEASAPSSTFSFLRRPAFGMPMWRPLAGGAMALILAVGVGLYENTASTNPAKNRAGATTEVSAVNDLQKLDKNEDLYSDFELLDDLKTDNAKSGTAKPGPSAEL